MSQYLLRLLRVPPEPSAPDGSSESIRIFRAGRNYYRWRVVVWAMTRLAGILGGIVALAFIPFIPGTPAWVRPITIGVEVLAIAALAAALPFSFMLQRLNYELRWYIVTDRSLRIRSGIWSVEEITMTFANIQDLRIAAGPLQGWLGLADLEVRSAGGGGAAGPHGETGTSHQARFEGVDNAEEIRDLIVERLRQYRDAGIGDAPAINMAGASAELLAEARALRAAVS